MSWLNPFLSCEEFTAEVESEFALDQPPVDSMQEFKDECLQSFGYTVDLVAFDDFDDNGTLVDDAVRGRVLDHRRARHAAGQGSHPPGECPCVSFFLLPARLR